MDMSQLIVQGLLMAVGAIGSWAIWVTRTLHGYKRDLDIAFTKIRGIENGGHSTKDCSCSCHETDD